ncbi:MAG: hypothetical protein KAT71_08295 [Gammaproteobacteria bacterium]|nr:hypothetical protein [Gammaproteobacteria bacterium]
MIHCSVAKEIKAEAWLVKSKDASLYRVVEDDDGDVYEEFIEIKDNKESELYVCWHKDDVKKWMELLTLRCE